MINKIIFYLYFLHLIKTQSESNENQNSVHIGGGRITIHIKRNLDPSKKSTLGQIFVNVDRMLDNHIDYVMAAIMKYQEMMRNEIDLEKDYNKKIENEKDLNFTLEKEDEDTNNTIINNDNIKSNKNKNVKSNKKDSKNNLETSESIKLREEREKFLKKQKLFTKICKYTLYSIILFTFYLLIKKLLEFLEIIEKPSINEINKEEEEERKQQYEREKVIKEKQVGNKIM